MNNTMYTVRSYSDGDELELCRMSNETYSKYFGFVSKTPEEWKASIILRPGFSIDGILIIENSSGVIIAFAAVDVSGKVLEMATNKAICHENEIELLIANVEKYAKAKGAQRVSIAFPNDDEKINKILHKFGYSKFLGYQAGMIFDYPKTLLSIMKQNLSYVDIKLHGSFLLVLDKCGKNFISPNKTNNLKISIDGSSVDVKNTDEEVQSGATIIRMNFFTFTEIIANQEKGFLRLFFQQKIKVSPRKDYLKVTRLFRLISLNKDWFIPFSDVR